VTSECIDFASAAAAVETAYELQYLPMDYLLKTEPTVYSFADLEREKTTIWDGVTNPAAVKHLREMKPGERLVIYHTGDEKSAVGTASVVSVDPSDPKTPKVTIKVGKAIAKPKTLAEIKARAAFAESPLVRQGRLSVVPLTAAQYAWLVGEGGGASQTVPSCARRGRAGAPVSPHKQFLRPHHPFVAIGFRAGVGYVIALAVEADDEHGASVAITGRLVGG